MSCGYSKDIKTNCEKSSSCNFIDKVLVQSKLRKLLKFYFQQPKFKEWIMIQLEVKNHMKI